MNEIKKVDQKKCAHCGKAFECSASSKCWCYEFDIPLEQLDVIEQEFDSCLCPECLKTYTRNP